MKATIWDARETIVSESVRVSNDSIVVYVSIPELRVYENLVFVLLDRQDAYDICNAGQRQSVPSAQDGINTIAWVKGSSVICGLTVNNVYYVHSNVTVISMNI